MFSSKSCGEMLSVCNGEEAFFDTRDDFVLEESVVAEEASDYDIWLREPQSVVERRNKFLYRIGFADISNEIEMDDSLLCERRKSNSEANCSVDYSNQDWLDNITINVKAEDPATANLCEVQQFKAGVGERQEKKVLSWWRSLSQKIKKSHAPNVSKESRLVAEAGRMVRVKTEPNRKRFMECSAVYSGQIVKAHNGLIWTMKFSHDGKYLASGGEDGVVCIWQVTMVDADLCSYMEGKPLPCNASVVIPDKKFHIEEAPLARLEGHRGDILDLAWSKSNHLLSSSTDKTIRLWRYDSDECLGVFHHSNYVPCVQFNPADESQFMSGCIDGKVRIWGIPSKRVKVWTNVQGIVTAVCYQPNGRGFVVGCLSGKCRIYESSGDRLVLNAEISIRGRKKSSNNKITSIQFINDDSKRMMITSDDSKIRILDGVEVVHKYKGLRSSGSQRRASFTSSGSHIVSIGEDSRVYLWNRDDLCYRASNEAKSTRSCESFFSGGATVVLARSDMITRDDHFASSTWPTSDRFSLANWFSMDASSRGSATWPEEKLPLPDCGNHLHYQQQQGRNGCGSRILSSTWALVFVTANMDGTIRIFHNYGLPVRI